MADDQAWQSGHYRDLPKVDKDRDHIVDFWQISDVFDIENLSLSVSTIASGESGPMHKHDAPIEELYICFEGQIDYEAKNPETGELEVEHAKSGTICYFPPGVPHRPVNRYDDDAVQLAIQTQGSTDEILESQTIVENDE